MHLSDIILSEDSRKDTYFLILFMVYDPVEKIKLWEQRTHQLLPRIGVREGLAKKSKKGGFWA